MYLAVKDFRVATLLWKYYNRHESATFESEIAVR